ncbi:hypothetical protein V1514DRAFT_323463 [Lipomyces japonicus]|uniref:uncharacterized protein n=1 Tax=Lipomyces japonicus TaxID=56871 RepID=UPI0034CEBA57
MATNFNTVADRNHMYLRDANVCFTEAEQSQDQQKLQACKLAHLPNEIQLQIYFNLDGESLINLESTCKRIRYLIEQSDELWKPLCLPLLEPSLPPGAELSANPYYLFKDMFKALREHTWFTPSVWHGDKELMGSFYVSRYNTENGAIEAHEFYCVRDLANLPPRIGWSRNPSILIQDFIPRLERSTLPILRLSAHACYDENNEIQQPPSPRGLITTFFRAAAILPERIYPSMSLWPPFLIPSKDRARNTSTSGFRNHLKRMQDASPDVFRLRKWITFSNRGLLGISMGEVVETISRLQDDLWKRNPEFPYRGIWVGDYSSHGGEFILFHQPTKYRLEAIKLTGDPNIPRGEYSFTVDDLSHTERICTEREWPGAKVVNAQGHTAHLNFTNSTFSDTQLILISENKVAHYWMNISRISIFRRVDVESLIRGGTGLYVE